VQILLQWKSNNITYREGVCVCVSVPACMYVDLGIRHALHRCYIVICDLSGCTVLYPIIS
jgi:hypothetical protein